MGNVHVVTALASIALGAAVFFRQKGGRAHVRLGYAYVVLLVTTNVSALSTYRNDGFGLFHVFAVVSLVTVTAGAIPAIVRMPKHSWFELHSYFMSWSYVGLIAAGAAQMATMAVGDGALPVLISSGLVVVLGGGLIHYRLPLVLNRTRSESSSYG